MFDRDPRKIPGEIPMGEVSLEDVLKARGKDGDRGGAQSLQFNGVECTTRRAAASIEDAQCQDAAKASPGFCSGALLTTHRVLFLLDGPAGHAALLELLLNLEKNRVRVGLAGIDEQDATFLRLVSHSEILGNWRGKRAHENLAVCTSFDGHR